MATVSAPPSRPKGTPLRRSCAERMSQLQTRLTTYCILGFRRTSLDLLFLANPRGTPMSFLSSQFVRGTQRRKRAQARRLTVYSDLGARALDSYCWRMREGHPCPPFCIFRRKSTAPLAPQVLSRAEKSKDTTYFAQAKREKKGGSGFPTCPKYRR